MTTASGAEFIRLSALIARQRRELDRLAAQAAARSVVDLARGVLMERLRCSSAQAQEQLVALSMEAGTSILELAAQITREATGEVGPPDLADPPRADPPRAEAARVALASAAAELAPDGSGVAAAVLEEALAPAGAVAVALWLAEPDGGLQLAGEAGFGPREASRWRRIHPDMDGVAQRAARGGLDSWWPAGHPPGDTAPLMGSWPDGARAVLPLPARPGAGARPAVALGAMEVCWAGPLPEFAPPVRRQLAMLTEVCAQALGTRLAHGPLAADERAAWALGLLDSLPGSALFATAVPDDAGTVTDFSIRYLSAGFRDPAGRPADELTGRPLLEAYPAAALPGGLYDRAVQVLTSGQPQSIPGEVISTAVGDAVVTPVMDVSITRLYQGVVIAWRRADEVERLTTLLEQAQRLGKIGGWEENLVTGDVVWTEPTFALFGRRHDAPVPVAELAAHVPADDVPAVAGFRDALLQEKRETAAAFRIIRADDQSVRQIRAFAEPVTDPAGTLVAVRGAYQDVSADYHTQVAFAATRDRLADTEERAEEDRRLALRLQRAITPRSARPVETPGLDVAARYRPAGQGSLVSGDWYDTVPLPTGKVLLVVGDIAGHGIDAVTGMVALRNCLRGLAITGAGPARLLSWLNRIACHLTDGIIGTAVCGLFDPADRTLHWARAGHLPPILVRDGAAEQLDLPQGVLLGADPDSDYEESTIALRPGDTLALFTDGLVERRDESIDDSMASLLAIAVGPAADIAGFADHLLGHARSDTSDDACLVAVRVR